MGLDQEGRRKPWRIPSRSAASSNRQEVAASNIEQSALRALQRVTHIELHHPRTMEASGSYSASWPTHPSISRHALLFPANRSKRIPWPSSMYHRYYTRCWCTANISEKQQFCDSETKRHQWFVLACEHRSGQAEVERSSKWHLQKSLKQKNRYVFIYNAFMRKV